MSKVLLILVDGMRPESLALCGHPFVNEMLAHSYHTLTATTVMPSVTLPCHMSLFHSVTPQRHGILSNLYVPQVRPVRGLCEVLKGTGRKSALFYNWEELRDLTRPDSICHASFFSGHVYGYEAANQKLADSLLDFLKTDQPEFIFLYLGWTDGAGHGNGWMSDEYIRSVRGSFSSIEQVVRALPEDYTVFLTADHGGHDRTHGTEMPEDMTIPLMIYRPEFSSKELPETNIIDIAPTIVKLLDVPADPEWEGKPLLS